MPLALRLALASAALVPQVAHAAADDCVSAAIAAEEHTADVGSGLELLQSRSKALSKEGEVLEAWNRSTLCSEVAACSTLGLSGYCCPAPNGEDLGCCFSSVSQKRQCLQQGRPRIAACPAHVEAEALTSQDVEMLCTQECLDGLEKLSSSCGLTGFTKTFDRICINPDATARNLRERRQNSICMDKGLAEFSTCPPNAEIVYRMLVNSNPVDVRTLCMCSESISKVATDCEYKALLKRLDRKCSASLLERAKEQENEEEEEDSLLLSFLED